MVGVGGLWEMQTFKSRAVYISLSSAVSCEDSPLYKFFLTHTEQRGDSVANEMVRNVPLKTSVQ